MADWQVPREWADVMYQYLVHGLQQPITKVTLIIGITTK